MAENSLVVCSDLVKIYETGSVETVALQGLDLTVAPGQLLAILGPGGCGKTTLVNILGGLDRPSAGQVWVDGRDLLKLTNVGLSRYRRTKVGFVWRDSTRNLIPYLTALENVELPMALAGRGGDRQALAQELLERVGLGDSRRHHLDHLSVMQQQLVALAAAVASSPKLLLADEPSGELDNDAAREILLVLRQLVEQEAVTVVVATHDASVAGYADTVVEMRDGQIV
jgi:ABC-type lipoprotein export system ATPase subunit